jgi:hypothetical protein
MSPTFDAFFRAATGNGPCGYQHRLAGGEDNDDARREWDIDPDLPPFSSARRSPSITLSLEPIELGLCAEKPFENQPSWAERMLAPRDAATVGPLRLAYWETLLRVADERASAKNHRIVLA